MSLVWQPWRRFVVERPLRTNLHWGLPIRWPKELSMCGATSWLLLVLSACTCAWSRPSNYTCWGFDVYHGRSRGGKQVVCGHMKGGPVSKCGGRARAGEARCSPFVLRPRFWEDGVHEWETNDVRSRATYTEEVKRTTVASVGLHGLHTPMRCSRGTLKPFLHVWTQLLFWRGRSLMHVVCVCVCGTTGVFASLGLNCLFGGAVRCTEGDDILQAQSCHGYYFLLRGVR